MGIAKTCQDVKSASIKLAACSTDIKNNALARIAQELAAHREEIFRANQEDLRRSESENVPMPLLKSSDLTIQSLPMSYQASTA